MFIPEGEDLAIEFFNLQMHLSISFLFVVQVVFHVHVDLVHIVIVLKQIISFCSLLHKVSVLSLQVTLFSV